MGTLEYHDRVFKCVIHLEITCKTPPSFFPCGICLTVVKAVKFPNKKLNDLIVFLWQTFVYEKPTIHTT